MALDDIFRMSVEGLGPNAQLCVCVFHYQQTTIAGQDTGEELAEAFATDEINEFAACIADDCLIQKVETRNVTQPLFGFDYAVSPAVTGVLAGEVLPSMVAAVISFRTGLIGRSRRGRCYMWPATEAMQNLSQWLPAYIADLAAFASTMQTIGHTPTGATYAQVVWSPTLSLATPVTSAIVDEIAGTQRRRRPGRGA